MLSAIIFYFDGFYIQYKHFIISDTSKCLLYTHLRIKSVQNFAQLMKQLSLDV
jgi:hypothetical protein